MVERWYARAVSAKEDGPLVFYGDYQAAEARIAQLERDLAEARLRASEQWDGRVREELRAMAAEAERYRLAAELAQERMDRDEKIARALAKADYEAERAGNIENENDRLAAEVERLKQSLTDIDRRYRNGADAGTLVMIARRASLQNGYQKG